MCWEQAKNPDQLHRTVNQVSDAVAKMGETIKAAGLTENQFADLERVASELQEHGEFQALARIRLVQEAWRFVRAQSKNIGVSTGRSFRLAG